MSFKRLKGQEPRPGGLWDCYKTRLARLEKNGLLGPSSMTDFLLLFVPPLLLLRFNLTSLLCNVQWCCYTSRDCFAVELSWTLSPTC